MIDERPPYLAHLGGEWVFSAPSEVPSIWGDAEEVAWPQGETLIIAGTDGAGKTVLAQNLIIRQAGIIDDPFLGLTVTPRRRVLYLAQDRPRQAQRAFQRLVGLVDRDTLDEGLAVIDWPVEMLIEEDPELLVRLATENEADTLYVDSLKDICAEPSTEVTGLAVRRAYSLCIAEGIEVCLLHHDRKATSDSKRRILKLADVYGSRFITAGAGSVIALNGGSGDPVIDLRHLKQPSQEVGPLRLSLDFATGEMEIFQGSDIYGILRNAKNGVTANDAARHLYGTEAPTAKERERARRKLESAVGRDRAHKKPGDRANEPTRYFSTEATLTVPLTEEVLA
ncbi:MAG TPA: AAA family ATPase [Acidimicrobiia bacterium]|nr:AAA family ATPase [Acidimicrobiia bacterium]